jgi:hypothetical protein
LNVRALDAAGNVDPSPASYTWTVDTTPPNTVIATSPANPTNDTTGDFTFTSPNGGTSFQCQLDGGAYAACSATYATAALAQGSHTLNVRALDAAGNVDPSPASYTWTVDTTAPDTVIATSPANPTNDTTGDFTFTSPNGGTSFECRVDGGAYAACAATYTTAALSEGAHTLDVRAVDAAGNVDATPVSYTWTVDSTAPDTLIDSAPPAVTADNTGSFDFSSPENGVSFECSLDSGAYAACPAAYTTAALADGPHTLEVRAVDAAGNVDASPAAHTWTVDTAPPNTVIASAPSNPTTDTSADFTFSSPDGGVAFECSLDNGAYAACGPSYTTPALSEGNHTLQVRASDAAGNVDPSPAEYSFAVDTTAPDTIIAASPTDPSNDPTADFSFTSPDGGVAFECSVDSAPFASCNATFATAALADGEHTLSVRALDAAGNTDPTPATYLWALDATAPDTLIDSAPSSVTREAVAAFTFSASDFVATYECSLDGSAFASCPKDFTTSALAEGAHTLSVRAKDALGNVDATPATHDWTVDLTPPNTVIAAQPSNPSASALGDFAFTSPDGGVRFECRVDDGAFASCSPEFTTLPLAEGTHTLEARAIDAVGNVDPSPASYTWLIDTLGPDTVITEAPENPTADRTGNFGFSSPDGGVRFECSVDGGAFAACAATWATPELSAGLHSLSVRAVDALDLADASPAFYVWRVTTEDDRDGDGLSNTDEENAGTNPDDADSDDDGVVDGKEPSATTDSDGDGLINALDPDSDNDGLFDGTELGLGCSLGANVTDLTNARCQVDADAGQTVTDPLDPDTDDGGVRDGAEDTNLDGRKDAGETDPTAGQGADDASATDTDGDGLTDAVEETLRSDPDDADSDDDGVLDGAEANPSDDPDRDGIPNIRDADSDGDGLFDGTELGLPCTNPATDAAQAKCVADGDAGATKTNPLFTDTDEGGVSDGSEDSNLNGVRDVGETDPNDPSDDDTGAGGAGGAAGSAGTSGGGAGAGQAGAGQAGASTGGTSTGGTSTGGASSGGTSSGGTGVNGGAAGAGNASNAESELTALGGGFCAHAPTRRGSGFAALGVALLFALRSRRRRALHATR